MYYVQLLTLQCKYIYNYTSSIQTTFSQSLEVVGFKTFFPVFHWVQPEFFRFFQNTTTFCPMVQWLEEECLNWLDVSFIFCSIAGSFVKRSISQCFFFIHPTNVDGCSLEVLELSA